VTEKEFGCFIAKLIEKNDLTKDEALASFVDIVENRQNEIQQGAFLAALSSKGVTSSEISAAWQTIYDFDTVQVSLDTSLPVVENCGTGMDTIKTFNISTAASIIAAADGVAMARHGARAITSKCGTIDIIEELGVNVECSPSVVKKSIETAGIGVFNGNSAQVHPKALGRILSKLRFGTVLNIAASLANPVLPKLAVRGVNKAEMLMPTIIAMKEIGFWRAIVVYGEAESGIKGGIDEASTMGRSHICELCADGSIRQYEINPEQFGIRCTQSADLLMGPDKKSEAKRLINLLAGQETPERTEIVCLNTALILYLAGRQPTIRDGYDRAVTLLSTDKPLHKLEEWRYAQQ